MTACRAITLLIVAASVVGPANGQVSPWPSSNATGIAAPAAPPQQTPAAKGGPLPVATAQAQDDDVFRVEWLERLVVGESEQSLDPFLDTNAGPPVSHQQAGRPGQTMAAPGAGPQAATFARQATASSVEGPAKAGRMQWLRQLLWGDSGNSEQLLTSQVATSSTIQAGHSQPPNSKATGSKALMVTGVPPEPTPSIADDAPKSSAPAENGEKSWLRRLISGDSDEDDESSSEGDEQRPPQPNTPSRWALPNPVAQGGTNGPAATPSASAPVKPPVVGTTPPVPTPTRLPLAPAPILGQLEHSYEDLIDVPKTRPQVATPPPATTVTPQVAGPVPAQVTLSDQLNSRHVGSTIDPFDERASLDGLYQGFMPMVTPEAEAQSATPTASNPYARPKIIFRPIARTTSSQGATLMRPTAQIVVDDAEAAPAPVFVPGEEFDAGEDIPPPDLPAEAYNVYDEQWAPMGASESYVDVGPWRRCWYTILANLNGPRSCPPGIGVENVMNAPFWLDTTQPLQNCRIRADAAADWEFPDRLEYFWPRTPGPKGVQTGFDPPDPLVGPNLGEPEVDYQELSFYIERGGDRFSVGTELPIIVVDPVDRLNTAGFGDMKLTNKLVLLDGRDWQLTHVMHTHFPTGSPRRGTGNGHFSLEPGVAWRYKWSDVTYFHGDLTYWVPIAADLEWSGQFFNYGIGISHILYDSDSFAVIPTFEINAWTLLDGRETLPRSVLFNEIDTYSVLNLHPGLRIVCDTAGDCGVREFGITGGVAVTQEHWYSEIIRLELRWVF